MFTFDSLALVIIFFPQYVSTVLQTCKAI